MGFEQICKDIKSLKIQGATNVAKAGIQAFKIRHDRNSLKKLLSLRPTEPLLRNVIAFCLEDPEKNPGFALEHLDESQKTLAEHGAVKIKNGDIVYTHCHSSAVTSILKEAFKTKKFEVYNTETRPRYQGRITAQELVKAKIPVTHFVDSAAKYALEKATIMLIGADAVFPDGKVVNKVGSGLFAEVAKKYGVPVFVCTDSWKLDAKKVFGFETKIEERDVKEVWDKAPKGVKIKNPAFDIVSSDTIDGIISELGIHDTSAFVIEVKNAYPWMLDNAP